MDGFERRKEQKKRNIRKAAFDLFSQYGVQRVSISEIAKKANVSQVTIYNYFGNKSELVKYVVKEYMNDIAKDFEPFLNSDLPFPEKLEKIIFNKKTAGQLMGDKGFFEVVSVQEPDIQEYLEEYARTKALPMMLELVEQGRKEGYVNPDISTDAILYYIQMFRDATSNPDLFRDENQKMLLDLASLFAYGLIGKPLERK
ncbi:MAG: TetR/AcrR family transcriptional regulator [Firmicutes bacterium]|nr:TetR/AcrR family transcriptional regulator [Bacillota bacterium]